MIQIAICDDDPAFTEKLKAMVKEIEIMVADAWRVSVFKNGKELLTAYENNDRPFDLILLDIEMPEVDGLHAAKRIKNIDETVVIIFITAFFKYALLGYRADAYIYLLKPIRKQSFQRDLLNAIAICRRRRQEYLLVENSTGSWKLPYRKILYIESFDKKKVVQTAEEAVVYYQKLDLLRKELEGQGFYQIHRSIIVNLAHVEHISKKDASILMDNGKLLPISRKKIQPFLDRLLEAKGRVL